MADTYHIGEFLLESKLGEGGMGVVFRARQTALDRYVALKLLSRPVTKGSKFIERFHREARAAAKLVHPNIIQIYTIGDHKGTPYFAMEYVDGVDLGELLEHGPLLSAGESVEVARGVAKALGVAMEQDVVHRDIKPGNIMITRSGLVKVMDFGLAKASADAIENLTQEGQIVGTPTYMSPEQGMSKHVDWRSDLYSLGCVLYESLTGRPPFLADNIPSIIFKHLYEEPVPPTRHNPDVPEALEKVCLKLLAKKPEDRYQSTSEVLLALSEVDVNLGQAEVSLIKRVKDRLDKQEESKALPKPRPTEEEIDQATKISPRPPTAPDAKGVVNQTMQFTQPLTLVGSGSDLRPPEAEAAKKAEAAAGAKAGSGTKLRSVPGSKSLESLAPKAADTPAARVNTVPSAPPSRPIPIPPSGAQARRQEPKPPTGAQAAASQKPSDSTALSLPAMPKAPTGTTRRTAPNVPDEEDEALPPPPKPPPSSSKLGTVRPASGSSLGSGAERKKKLDSRIVTAYFKRLNDGRWGYDTNLGPCEYAEGLASENLPGKNLRVGSLGDCLTCGNWTSRTGCAIATTEQIKRISRKEGVPLFEELGAVWCAAGRFDLAIEPLNDYLKSHPIDASGFRALARIYERPDYHGPDKARVVVLYQRCVELAEEHGGLGALELKLVKDRLTALQEGRAKLGEAGRSTGEVLHHFRCFYRASAVIYFAFGAMSRDRMVLARAGEVDPDTGISVDDMSNPLSRVTSIFRRLRGEKSRTEERELVRQAILELENTPFDALPKKSDQSLSMGYETVRLVDLSEDKASGNRTVKMHTTGGEHELVFPAQSWVDAERCAAIVKRITGK
ncbi:MAG: hypothetical protein AMXMBFR7_08520 [Planctomycetota bacterium]